MKQEVRLALIGWGAMAKSLAGALAKGNAPIQVGAIYSEPMPTEPIPTARVLQSVDELVAWKPTLVAECAGHGAVKAAVPKLLEAGIDVVVASVGALCDRTLRDRLQAAAATGGGQLILPSGAIGGLDALSSARQAGLDKVVYTGRKPPRAWKGTPAAERWDMDQLSAATVIFAGTAEEAARLFPQNANVTAAVALAGVGFERTSVQLIADPEVSTNTHEVDASGAFGSMQVRLANTPLPENPKTSWLAALSLERVIRQQVQRQPF